MAFARIALALRALPAYSCLLVFVFLSSLLLVPGLHDTAVQVLDFMTQQYGYALQVQVAVAFGQKEELGVRVCCTTDTEQHRVCEGNFAFYSAHLAAQVTASSPAAFAEAVMIPSPLTL